MRTVIGEFVFGLVLCGAVSLILVLSEKFTEFFLRGGEADR